MKDSKKRQKHEAISAAAYALLEHHGYDGTSMLRIAKAAHASNETLYRWYGDKRGLFTQLVKDNATETQTLLETAIAVSDHPVEVLRSVAPVFLAMLLGERAILLNRAAAAEPTGELGRIISKSGRDVVQPLFDDVMDRLVHDQTVEAKRATQWFIGLLVGDLQIKRILGVQPALEPSEISAQVDQAIDALIVLVTAR